MAVVVVSGVLSAATVLAGLTAHPTTARLGVDIAAAVLSCAASPLLLRRPVAATLGMAVLAALSPAATPAASLGALMVARCRRLPVAIAVSAAGVGAQAVQGLWRPNAGISYLWWLALIAAAYAALTSWGALTQAREALVGSLRDRAHRAEAEQGRRVAEARIQERRRIAWEMHDVLAHRLSLLATYGGALEYRPDAPPEQLARAAGVIRAEVHRALDDLRQVLRLLREDGPGDELGSPVALDGLALDGLARLVDESRAVGTTVYLRNDLDKPADVPPGVGRAAYRVVQEALTNARKHAHGQPVHVTLTGRPGAHVEVEIRNPLPAPRAATTTLQGAGAGLVGLTERVRLTGGQLDHGPIDDEFRVHARLPWLV